MSITIGKLDSFPRTVMSHTPTPIDEMPNLARYIGATNLYIKRDDCTGLGMGGNKSRQLEFYVGQAEAEGADTLVITGAVQSNFTRMAVAAACKRGICVRRSAKQQQPRIANHCRGIAELLDIKNPVTDDDVDVSDDVFSPGYGKLNDAVEEAIKLTANKEGIILDPVYSGKAMAGFLNRARRAGINQNLLFLHTGGQPAVFAYEAELEPLLSDNIE